MENWKSILILPLIFIGGLILYALIDAAAVLLAYIALPILVLYGILRFIIYIKNDNE